MQLAVEGAFETMDNQLIFRDEGDFSVPVQGTDEWVFKGPNGLAHKGGIAPAITTGVVGLSLFDGQLAVDARVAQRTNVRAILFRNANCRLYDVSV